MNVTCYIQALCQAALQTGNRQCLQSPRPLRPPRLKKRVLKLKLTAELVRRRSSELWRDTAEGAEFYSG